jgi:hypothetical protein
VTFPARQYSVNGERRSFALLRPVADASAQDRIRELGLEAYGFTLCLGPREAHRVAQFIARNIQRRVHVSIFDVNAIESAEPRHSSSDSASIRLKTATVARQSPFIAAAPASP